MQFGHIPERLRVYGLDLDTTYSVEEYGEYTGKGLKTVGIPIYVNGDMKSKIVHIKSVQNERMI